MKTIPTIKKAEWVVDKFGTMKGMDIDGQFYTTIQISRFDWVPVSRGALAYRYRIGMSASDALVMERNESMRGKPKAYWAFHGEKWTKEEIAELKKWYPTELPADTAKRLNRSVDSVKKTAQTHGVRSGYFHLRKNPTGLQHFPEMGPITKLAVCGKWV